MRKTFLAVALATAMVVTAVPTLPVSADTAVTTEAAEVLTFDKNVGKEDLSAGFFTAFSDHYKIEDGKSYQVKFDVYGGASNWNNFFMLFTNVPATSKDANADYTEYAVVRADSYGWSVPSSGNTANKALNGSDITYSNTLITSEDSWNDFRAIMEKAAVDMTVSRSGKNVTVKATVKSKTDETKTFDYTAQFEAAAEDGTDATDLYFALGVDGSMLAPSSDKVVEIKKDITTRAVTLSAGDTRVSIPFVSKVEGVKATFKVNDGKEIEGTLSSTGMSVAADVGTLKAGDKVTVTITGEGYNDKVITLTAEGAPAATKKSVKINKVTSKKGATKVTGTVSVAKATVKVKVGKKAYKAAKVTGKKFTLKVAKLTKGTKVVVKATKKNYKAATKTVTVK